MIRFSGKHLMSLVGLMALDGENGSRAVTASLVFTAPTSAGFEDIVLGDLLDMKLLRSDMGLGCHSGQPALISV